MIVTILVAVFIGLGFSSCDKDSGDIVVVKEKKLMKITYGDILTTFKYDTQGHLTEIVDTYVSGGTARNYTCVWGENKVDFTYALKVSETDADAIYEETATLNLNDGLATEVAGTGVFLGGATLTYGGSYRLSQFVGFISNVTFEWNDDKLKFLCNTTTTGGMYDITYTYESNIVTEGYNPIIPLEMSSNSFFTAHPELAGISSQRLPDSSVRQDWVGDSYYISTYDYAYEFDEDGYVTKIIASRVINNVEVEPTVYAMIWE